MDAGRGKPGAEAVAEACESWLSIERVKNRTKVETMMESFGLDVGEAEAIVLCQETGRRTILLDDQSAVHVARSLGFDVLRTAALYVTAKRYRLIEEVRPKLDALRRAGFWLKDADYFTVLRVAGESA